MAPASALFVNSSLYTHFLMQREEINKHKWILSEQKGEDVGFDYALIDWTLKHRQAWLESLKPKA